MANIALTFAPEARPFPFDTDPIGGGVIDRTALPRGRVTFQINDGAIAAKIATNTTTILTTCVLPANYAYTFEYASVQASFATSASDAANFESLGMMLVNLGDGLGGRRAQMFSRGAMNDGLAVASQIAWEPLNVFPSPIFNTEGATPQVLLRFADLDAGATVAGLLATVVSFLQYDIEQVFNVGVNYPVPVSNR